MLRRLALAVTMAMPGLKVNAAPHQQIQTRVEYDLHGEWKVAPAEVAHPPPAIRTNGWDATVTPGMYGDGIHTHFWFARSLDFGTAIHDRVYLLQLDSACFRVETWLNGRRCGEAVGGYAPIEIDITSAVQPGTNILMLRMGTWETVATNLYPPVDSLSMSHAKKRVGLWQNAQIVSMGPVYIANAVISPSVKNKRLTIKATIVNRRNSPASGGIAATIFEQNAADNASTPVGTALSIPPTAFSIGSFTQQTVTIEAHWPTARFWWPHDPYLYLLGLEIRPSCSGESGPTDAVTIRFGFREVCVRGTDLLLNDQKLVLRGISWTRYSTINTNKQAVRQKLKELISSTGGNAVRLHYDPMEQCVLDVADEMGVLLLVQSPLLYTIYGEKRRSFWEAAQDQWLRYVRRSQHHPSVVVWAVANEGTFNDYGISRSSAPSLPFLAQLARKTREIDPTRPVTSSHDFTLGGASDFFDAVHAWGFETDPTFPKSARKWDCFHYWTFYRYSAAKRYRRDRPWSNDEWAEGFNLHLGGLLFGDDAYVHADGGPLGDVRNYWTRLAQSYSTYVGTIEQRRQPYFCSIMPFGDRFSYRPADGSDFTYDTNMVALAHRAMADVILAPIEWNSSGWGGEPYRRLFELMNDGFVPLAGRIKWTIRDNRNDLLLTGEQPFTLQVAEHRAWSLQVNLPSVAKPTLLSLDLDVLEHNGTMRYHDSFPLAVFPRSSPDSLPPFTVWPSAGTWKQAAAKWPFLNANPASRLPPAETPVVVPRRARLSPGQWRALSKFVHNGGRVLIMEDENLPGMFGGVPLRLSGKEAVMAHKKTPSHPVVRDLPDVGFRYWVGANGTFYSPPAQTNLPDFVIARNVLRRPVRGNALTILEAGLAGIPRLEGDPGLTLAPLIEVRHGQGRALFCTLLLAEGIAQDEPAAVALFERCLEYLADSSRHIGKAPRPAVAVGDAWRSFGVQTTTNFTHASVLLVQANSPEGEAFLAERTDWLDYVRGGGTALLHRLSIAQIEWLAQQTGLALRGEHLKNPAQPYPYPTRLDWITTHPLRFGLGHFETDWIDTGWLSAVKARQTIAEIGINAPSNSVLHLTSHGALTLIPLDQGMLAVDQTLWSEPIRNTYIRRRADNYIVQLLNNLDVKMHAPSSGPIDLYRNIAGFIRSWKDRIMRMRR